MSTTSCHLASYRPQALYYQDADALEYVRVDEPVIYRRVDASLSLILAVEDRKPVGFKLKGFRNFFIRHQGRLDHKAGSFPLLTTIIENMMTELGEALFKEAPRQEAYRRAAEIAMEDQVVVSDIPAAA